MRPAGPARSDGTKLVAVAANGYIYTSSSPLP
jgi:hypothetical protein